MAENGLPAARRLDATGPHSFVEWGAVFAGAVLAAALSFVFLTFGTAIGISATSPWPDAGVSAKVIASLAVFWAIAQQIGSVMVGGYVAGRMRSRWHETGHEADFRDGLHGGLVWALGVLISASLLVAAANTAASSAAQLAAGAAARATAMDAVVDPLFRPSANQAAGSPASGGTASTNSGASEQEDRSAAARVLSSSVTTGSLMPENKTYLAQIIARRTGLSQQQAETRVDQAFASAREAADKARRAAVLTGFVTAAGMLISLAAGWWGAVRGGDHRDNNVPARFVLETTKRRSAH